MTPAPTLVDIGLNLAHDSFDADRAEVIATAMTAGVRHMVITGSSLASTRQAIELVRTDPRAFSRARRACIRITPATCARTTCHALRELLAAPRKWARPANAASTTSATFRRTQIRNAPFAGSSNWPSSAASPCSCTSATPTTPSWRILRDYLPRLAGGVAHCFTGDERELRDYLDLGLLVGITGWICDERRGRHLRELVRSIPLDRLLVETDAPYLLPRDLQPKPAHRRNEPKYLPHVVKVIAACRGEPISHGRRGHDPQCAKILRLSGGRRLNSEPVAGGSHGHREGEISSMRPGRIRSCRS